MSQFPPHSGRNCDGRSATDGGLELTHFPCSIFGQSPRAGGCLSGVARDPRHSNRRPAQAENSAAAGGLPSPAACCPASQSAWRWSPRSAGSRALRAGVPPPTRSSYFTVGALALLVAYVLATDAMRGCRNGARATCGQARARPLVGARPQPRHRADRLRGRRRPQPPGGLLPGRAQGHRRQRARLRQPGLRHRHLQPDHVHPRGAAPARLLVRARGDPAKVEALNGWMARHARQIVIVVATAMGSTWSRGHRRA